ncbi:MAG TPA: GIY-YIG nuclease family protein [Microbacterium sp.]|nr:GIY-YIG nuclease family protein [Microbacterium sp.]
MSFERYRCPACDHLSVIFDDQPFACQNPTCGIDAAVLREPPAEGQTREQFMREHALVYYLALGNRVKIGTTTDLPSRMKALPHEELLAFEFGSYDVERTRHNQFAHARAAGEWFDRADAELTAWISALRADLEDPSDVPRSASRAVKRRILGLEPV